MRSSPPTEENRIRPHSARQESEGVFIYHGGSMAPVFRPGQVLYVRPSARDLAAGDVVVFSNPARPGKHTVHRVVRITPAGVVTRGDANLRDDPRLVPWEALVGRVEQVDDGRRPRRVAGGRRGLWAARGRWAWRWADHSLRRLFYRPYAALRAWTGSQRLLARLLAPHLKSIRLQSPDGPLVKTLFRGRVVARWQPALGRFECRKPFDLAIRPPDTE